MWAHSSYRILAARLLLNAPQGGGGCGFGGNGDGGAGNGMGRGFGFGLGTGSDGLGTGSVGPGLGASTAQTNELSIIKNTPTNNPIRAEHDFIGPLLPNASPDRDQAAFADVRLICRQLFPQRRHSSAHGPHSA